MRRHWHAVVLAAGLLAMGISAPAQEPLRETPEILALKLQEDALMLDQYRLHLIATHRANAELEQANRMLRLGIEQTIRTTAPINDAVTLP
jgi:hypothetical protein